MKCETCGMNDGNHDRACIVQQLHDQKIRIMKKLAGVKKQYEGGDPGPLNLDIGKLCITLLDSVINIVREA